MQIGQQIPEEQERRSRQQDHDQRRQDHHNGGVMLPGLLVIIVFVILRVRGIWLVLRLREIVALLVKIENFLFLFAGRVAPALVQRGHLIHDKIILGNIAGHIPGAAADGAALRCVLVSCSANLTNYLAHMIPPDKNTRTVPLSSAIITLFSK